MEILSSKFEVSVTKVDELSSLGHESLISEIMETLENKSQEIKTDFKNDFKTMTKNINDKDNDIRTLNQRSDDIIKSIDDLKNEQQNLSKFNLFDYNVFYIYPSDNNLLIYFIS